MSTVTHAANTASERRYNVVFSGAVRSGFDVEQVTSALAKLVKIDPAKAKALLSGQSRVVKSNLDQNAATQLQSKYAAIGVQCAVQAVGVTPEPFAAPRPGAAAETPKKITSQTIRAEFEGKLPADDLTRLQYAGLAAAASAAALAPVLYFTLVVATGWMTLAHALNHWTWFVDARPAWLGALAYAFVAAAGAFVSVVLVKPLIAPMRVRAVPVKLSRADDGLFFAFVDQIADHAGAPAPVEIDVDCSTEISVVPQRGLSGLLQTRLVLTIGLPVLGGLSARELAGTIAGELRPFAPRRGTLPLYLLRSVRRWLAWRAHERDAWDDRIDVVIATQKDYRAGLLTLAKGVIWFSRKLVAALEAATATLHRKFIRRAAFAADRAEAGMAGSEAFAASVRKMLALRAAADAVFHRYSYNRADPKLSDNYPRAVVEQSHRLPERYADAVAHELAAKTSRWSAQPSARERIDNTSSANAPAIFRLDADAAILLPRFERLCKQATLTHYRHVFGLQVKVEQLVGTAATAPAETREASESKLNDYTAGLFHVERYLSIKRQVSFADPDVKEIKLRIDDWVQQLRDAAPEYKAALARYLDAARSPEQAAGVDEEPLRKFETLMAQRIALTLSTRTEACTQDEVTQLLQALAALAKTRDVVKPLRATSPSSGEHAAASAQSATAYDQVCESLGKVPDPFAPPDGKHTLADALRKYHREDAAHPQQRALGVCAGVDALHKHLMARIATLAFDAEEKLGVMPIAHKPPPPPTEDPNVVDDKLPY
jgi:hypothetical protein